MGEEYIKDLVLIDSGKYKSRSGFTRRVKREIGKGELFVIWVDNGEFLVMPKLDVYIENWCGPSEHEYKMNKLEYLLRRIG